MILHVADAAKQYNTAVDSDVVVLAVYMFAKLTPSLTVFWVAFGTGKNYRLIPAHRICTAIGHMKCLALRCSMPSLVVTLSLAFLAWNVFPEATDKFIALMEQPQHSDLDAAMITLERFVILLYDKTNSKCHINEVRLDLFAQKG